MRRHLLSLGPLAVLALVPACSNNSYRSATLSGQTGDPAAILDFNAGISIPEGSATSAHIDMMSQSNKPLTGSDIQSANGSILRVLHTPGDTSKYVFLGVHEGTTNVLFLVNGQQVQTVTATVVAPPASSIPPTLDAGVQPGGGGDAGDSSVPPADAGGPDGDAALAAD